MPDLWCKNDPIIKIQYEHNTAVIKIITKTKFSSGATPETSDPIYMELTLPLSCRARVLKESNNPLTPQEFSTDTDDDLTITDGVAACSLYIELPDELDPANINDVDEVVVLVMSRRKANLAEHHFLPSDTDDGNLTLHFNVDLEAHDHSDEVIADSSTWS